MNTPLPSRLTPPLVSVIIPSYNHAQYLRECLDSVLNQNYPNLEIIVVDDNSTDDSMAVLQEYETRITLLQQSGGRQARARNLALKVAKGEYVAFLDSDDRYMPGRIRSAIEAFAAHPEADLVWGNYRTIDQNGMVRGEYTWKPRMQDFRLELISGNPICNATATVRRSALDDIGGFDEQVPRVCDGAAWYQLAALNKCFVHIPVFVLDYRVHFSNDSSNFMRMTRDRDTALVSAAQAFVANGVVSDDKAMRWLRGQLVKQFSFRAAAWVHQRLSATLWNQWGAQVLEWLGSERCLNFFSFLQQTKLRIKKTLGR